MVLGDPFGREVCSPTQGASENRGALGFNRRFRPRDFVSSDREPTKYRWGTHLRWGTHPPFRENHPRRGCVRKVRQSVTLSTLTGTPPTSWGRQTRSPAQAAAPQNLDFAPPRFFHPEFGFWRYGICGHPKGCSRRSHPLRTHRARWREWAGVQSCQKWKNQGFLQ